MVVTRGADMSASDPRHGRLAWLRPEQLTAAQRRVYDQLITGPRASARDALSLTDPVGRLEGRFNAMLANPAVGGPLQNLGAAIRFHTSLSARAREIAILEVAVACKCEFEWYVHERLGRRAGLSPLELDALRRSVEAAAFTVDEAAVREVVRSLLRTNDLDDQLFESATRLLGVAAITDLIFLVGYYQMLALAMRALRTPLRADKQPIFVNQD